MPRYIDAEKVVPDAIQERKFVIQTPNIRNFETTIRTVYADLADFIAAQPTADVVEVRHGKWIAKHNPWVDNCYVCSICDTQISFLGSKPKFCPHCGAKMDGEREK